MATHVAITKEQFTPSRSVAYAPRVPAGQVLWRNPPARPSAAEAARSAVPARLDQARIDGLALRLLPLVKRVAFEVRDHLPIHLELDDLMGAGVLGLLDALRKFDPRKQVKVESYARHRIRGAILDSLRKLDSASRDLRKKNKMVERTYRNLGAKLGRPAEDGEMAEALGVSLEKWYRTVEELQGLGLEWLRPVSSHTPVSSVENLRVTRREDDPFEKCYRREQKEIVARALARLRQRDRLIVTLYYYEGLTMRQIAARLSVDESRVSQLHSAAVTRLRSRVAALLGRPPGITLPLSPVPAAV